MGSDDDLDIRDLEKRKNSLIGMNLIGVDEWNGLLLMLGHDAPLIAGSVDD